MTVGFRSSAFDGARRLPFRVRGEVANGMAADGGADAPTRGAAKVVGAHDRIGQIGVGMEADLLIWKGHPFEGGSRLERVCQWRGGPTMRISANQWILSLAFLFLVCLSADATAETLVFKVGVGDL